MLEKFINIQEPQYEGEENEKVINTFWIYMGEGFRVDFIANYL